MLKLKSDVAMYLESKKSEYKSYMIAFIIFSVIGIISSVICFLLFLRGWEKITSTSQLVQILLLFTFSISFTTFLILQIFELYAQMRHYSLILEMNDYGDLEKLVIGIPETGKSAPFNLKTVDENTESL